MDPLAARWNAFTKRKFPTGWGGRAIDGVELVELDSAAAGCVSSYLHNSRRLDPDRRELLVQCAAELDQVVPSLAGDVRDYFSELREIANEVLRCAA